MSSSAVDRQLGGWQDASRAAAALRYWLAGLIVAFACTLPVSAQPVKTEHVTAELVAERSAVQPGQPLRIGLLLQHIPHWHTYWRNPGESGLPTTLSWTLPARSQAGEIDWPAPKRLPIGPLVNYGYEGELLLPLTYTPPADARPSSTLSLQAKATWLVCRDVCIPESATLTLQLPVVGASASADAVTPGSAEHTALFERARGEQSAPLAGWAVDAQQAGRELLVTFSKPLGPAAPRPALQLFPYAEQLIEPARHEVFRTDSGYAVKLRLVDGVAVPASLSGIAVAQGVTAPGASTVWGGTRRSAEFDTPVRSVAALVWPEGAKALADTDASATTPETLGGGADLGWATALLLAFVGGMVLNLMPCVFPVLSIKLLSLARHGGDEQPPTATALRTHALAYSAGVLLSFLALAALLLALRAAGSAIGWGFQLQEPGVVFVLALLFFALGLNLMGAFEFGGLLPQGLAAWRDRRPAVDALASGVLAVVAASPCTAPFMGAALGYAITQSPAVGLSVFGALGLGMALPYALLVLTPGWRSRLPRPGTWMLRLKQALAFPMFLTVIWLVWVLGQQTGIDGAAKALIALVVMAFAIWVAGARSSVGAAGDGRPLARRAIGGLMLAGALAWGWPGAALTGSVAAARTAAPGAPDAAWAPYDETVIAERLAAGQPVFVDFTAAWCVSCQVNKRLVLHTDATMQAFARANVALMRADWTQRDARITEALARLGRNGVPVYVLLRPGREPLLLPEILTAKLVRDALATL